LGVWTVARSGEPAPRLAAPSTGTSQPTPSPIAPLDVTTEAEPRRIEVAEAASIELAPNTHVRVHEAEREVELVRGELVAQGDLEVRAPGCSCQLHGRARVRAEATLRVSIVIIAGSAQSIGPSCSSTRLELVEPSEPAPTLPEAEAPSTSAMHDHPRGSRGATVTDVPEPLVQTPPPPPVDPATELAERVDRFERAQARIEDDPEGAARSLRALMAEWPDSPIEGEMRQALQRAEAHSH